MIGASAGPTDHRTARRLGDAVAGAGWRFPLARWFASRHPLVLLYHSVPRRGAPGAIDAAAFEHQMTLLSSHFEVVPSDCVTESRRRRTDRIRVAITFDDGFRNNAEVAAPVLRRLGLPATFFVCSHAAAAGSVLWVVYFKMLKEHFPERVFTWRGNEYDCRRPHRAASLLRLWRELVALRPHPQAIYAAIEDELPPLRDFVSDQVVHDQAAGMTAEHVRDLAADPLFRIGAHTASHPFLSQCSRVEVDRQLTDNKQWIEEATGRPCDEIAYPSGDYTLDVVRACRDAGFTRAFAVAPRFGVEPGFEIPRVGVYRSSGSVLGLKVQWGRYIRALHVPVG